MFPTQTKTPALAGTGANDPWQVNQTGTQYTAGNRQDQGRDEISISEPLAIACCKVEFLASVLNCADLLVEIAATDGQIEVASLKNKYDKYLSGIDLENWEFSERLVCAAVAAESKAQNLEHVRLFMKVRIRNNQIRGAWTDYHGASVRLGGSHAR